MAADSSILQLASALAHHASVRQSTVAKNIAHADTPGYKAEDVKAFSELLKSGEAPEARRDVRAAIKPNGNSVDIEAQVVKLTESKGQHDLALGLYERTLEMYRTAIGRGR